MIQLTNEQINEIADNLDCGFRCFINIKTGEIKEIDDLVIEECSRHLDVHPAIYGRRYFSLSVLCRRKGQG